MNLSMRSIITPKVAQWCKRGLWTLCMMFIMLSVVRWGGVARPGPLLWLGILLLGALISGFALLIWWLYSSPLPSHTHPRAQASHAQLAQKTVLFVLFAGVLFVTGTMWDEVWHRKFGGFGNDFLWPPHLLIYGSIALILIFAFIAFITLWRGQGSIRERIRTMPFIGLLGLCAAFMMSSLPSDALWHEIYGLDLTAWSLPHVLLITSFSCVMLSGVALQTSLIERSNQWRIVQVQGSHLIIVCLISIVLFAQTQLWTAEYQDYARSYGVIRQATNDVFRTTFWLRPLWLLPMLCATLAMFHGMLVQSILKRIGAATLVGLISLVCRALLMAAFDANQVRMNMINHALILIPMVCIDLWFAWAQHKKPHRFLIPSLLGGASFVVIGLPAMHSMLSYPPVQQITLPTMIMMTLLGSLVGGYAGATLGKTLLNLAQREQ